MTEMCSIEIEMPEFMRLVDAGVKNQIIEEVNNEIRDEITQLFTNAAQNLIARKLDLISSVKGVEKREEREKEKEEERNMKANNDLLEVKTALAEEVLSVSRKEALEKLKLSLATGKIDENTYRELKSLVRPAGNVCPQCGKQLEPTANFCRFCGFRIT
jgi:hypothetical protein